MSDTYPRVLAVGDRAVTVELGPSLDEETVGRVRALDDRLREASLPGVLETVPTYASLMVIYDRGPLPFAKLRQKLLGFALNLPAGNPPGRLVEIPTLYDGEDLDEVAVSCGLTREGVIELHSGRDYSALMLGFSPGFAYLGFVDERLRLPRRKTPRTRVPAGSVAVAGPQTGIYPRTLPGGWNLLGRTTLKLFDPQIPLDAGPSRLMPGDRVRFVPALSLDPAPSATRTNYSGSGVLVLEPGILTTIQDGGRPGLRRVAVPLTGYADAAAARVANACVGNPEDAPTIEICGPGLKLQFEKTAFVALTGAIVAADLERADLEHGLMPMPMNVAVRARASNTLTVRRLENGVRAYVADLRNAGAPPSRLRLGGSRVSIPAAPGSGRSTDRGGLRFRPGAARPHQGRSPSRHRPRDPGSPDPAFRRTSDRDIAPDSVARGSRLRSGGRAARWSPPEARGLSGDRLGRDGARAAFRVPPDGRPIVMLSDCPTTGGYPKIACVVSDDLGIVAQAIPAKTAIRFVAVGIEDL